MNKLKEKFGFEFWQKFGKALMVVIAVMPAAGLMISIGKTIAMINPNMAPLVITGGFIEQIGWGVIGNLHILFALAIGGSWAKERAGGAFAAGLAFILINRMTGSIFGVTSDILADKAATVHTIFGQSIKVSDYFISVLEAPALNMGVFVGIIQSGINGFGMWIASSKETAPILAPFLFGTLERLLLPFGLHHMLTIPINYTQLGGT